MIGRTTRVAIRYSIAMLSAKLVRVAPVRSWRSDTFRVCGDLVARIPSWARAQYGPVKKPTFSAAKSGLSPVMNTAEHMTLAYPDAWCSSASPGGGM